VTRVLVLTAICAAGLAEAGNAQGRYVVEVGAGGGYVAGGGAENPGPSLPSYDVVVAVWPFERWGVGVRWVEGPGEDLHAPIESFDRTFLGTGHLRYWTVTARHRRPLPRRLELEIGFGLLFDGEFATIVDLHNPPGPPRRLSEADTFFTGMSVDGLVTRDLGRHFAIKGGLTFDFNFETTNVQPVALAVVRF
jgi:hypothetical protein